jgi:putative serine protease PepD
MSSNFSLPTPIFNILQFIFIFIIVLGILLLALFGFVTLNPADNLSQRVSRIWDSGNSAALPIAQPAFMPNTFGVKQGSKSVVDIVEQNLPSVLSINVIAKNQGNATAGTGYIVSDDGLVVTNKHVISLLCGGFEQAFKVVGINNDQTVFDLELKSVDPIDDIAILKIKNPPTNLKKIEFGDSNNLKLGEDVVAVGNALGTLQNSVTKGVVSGLDRSFESGGLVDECTKNDFQVNGLIQTDAAINKGNSGGPLFNSAGQIIGMNTLGTEGAQGVGLAIPSATILTSLNSFFKNNQIIRPRLGVVTQSIDPAKKLQDTWLPVEYGEFIGSLDLVIPSNKVVSPGSSAEDVGLKYGDIILEINGEKLLSKPSNPSPLRRKILTLQPSDSVSIKYLRAKNNDTNKEIVYESTPQTVNIKLKGIAFNLGNSELQTVNSK